MASHRDDMTILIGRLGQNPKQSGDSADFQIYHTNLSQDGTDEISWFDISAKGKLAEVVMANLVKEDLVCVEGKLTPEFYEGKSMKIIADRILFLSHKKNNQKNNQEVCNG